MALYLVALARLGDSDTNNKERTKILRLFSLLIDVLVVVVLDLGNYFDFENSLVTAPITMTPLLLLLLVGIDLLARK